MDLKISFNKEFDSLMENLKEKYGQQLFDMDGIGKQTDFCEFSRKFFTSSITADASIDANANVESVDVIAYNIEMPKPTFRLNSYYILWKELKRQFGADFANLTIEMQLRGDIYIHDFHGIAAGEPYCFNYSTYDIMLRGLPMVKKIDSQPPKHLYAFKSQLEQFTVIASNSTLGATGLADLLIVMSYYVSKILKTGSDAHFELISLDLAMSFNEEQRHLYLNSKLQTEAEIKATLSDEQKAIIEANNFYSEATFKCLTEEQLKLYEKRRAELVEKLSKTFDADQNFFYERSVFSYVKENLVSFIYTINQPMRANQSPFTNVSVYDKYFLESMVDNYVFPDGSSPDIDIINKLQIIYIETMNQEMRRTQITFPVTTACFSINDERDILDGDFARTISEYNSEYGFINIYHGKSSTLSSCCRLRSDIENEFFNSFGAGATKIGSLGVCTINMPRLAIMYPDLNDFSLKLREMVAICAKINNAKREIVRKRIENGNLPLYTMEFMSLSKQYSTVGINGLYECLQYLGFDILTQVGLDIAVGLMEVCNNENEKWQRLYGAPHNCEQIPGENTSIKMAAKDHYLGYQDTYDIYSNQFVPLISNTDMLQRMKIQGIMDSHFSGGSILHLNVEEKITDPKALEDLIHTCAKMGVIYWAINYNLQKCENGHMSVGKNTICPICGEVITDNFTRVVGFLTNVKNWHKVRREQDYPVREFYKGVRL